MRFTPSTLLSSGNMSSNLVSSSQDLNQIISWSIECTYTGSPVGICYIQYSNDNINWVDNVYGFNIPGTSSPFGWKERDASQRYVRVSYIAISGSGSLNVIFTGKGV